MKRILIIVGTSLTFLFICGIVGIHIWIGQGVQENIHIAKKQYGGTAEDALIAYLLDTTNSPQNRTHLAIWTLGQIQSKKAIPIINKLYKNDPEGKTCRGKHHSLLCQYEIYKALHAKEVNWWPLHPEFNR